MMALFFRAALDNPMLLIANRLTMFHAVMGADIEQFYHDYAPTHHLPKNPACRTWMVEHLWNMKQPKSLALFAAQIRKLLKASTHTFLWSAYPSFALLLLILARFRRMPSSAALAAILLARLGAIILFMPTASYKYVYFIPLSAAVLIPFAYFEWQAGRKEVDTVKRTEV
ncbi:MAG: hypothetical protein U9N14_06225 [Pseudomonadota bacterium]|nr:hypothetical protein [Pseudomonadota bacterium]